MSDKRIRLLAWMFMASGVAALVYQVAWQRILFAAFGVDLESVTIVVSAFMLGLGLGALLGGWVADRWPHRALTAFVLAEAGIGLFGLASPFLLRWFGEQFALLPLPGIALANFVLIAIPTLLMGATLPVLIAFVAYRWQHIGKATGFLYSLNTLGAAIGSLASGYWLFHVLTLDGAIALAACANLAVAGIGAWRLREVPSST